MASYDAGDLVTSLDSFIIQVTGYSHDIRGKTPITIFCLRWKKYFYERHLSLRPQ